MITGTILDEIIAHKRVEIAREKERQPPAAVRDAAAHAAAPRDFLTTLRAPGVSLIAEVKRASPSAGDLRPDLDPAGQAGIYESNGAAAISVLTDQRFFHGSLEDLHAIRSTVSLPVLRKDFILDPYQVAQARAHEADAILLIVVALDDASLHDLQAMAFDMGMAVLVEVHNREELDRALALDPRIIGINNRDLRTFDVSLATTASLRPHVPTGRCSLRRAASTPPPMYAGSATSASTRCSWAQPSLPQPTRRRWCGRWWRRES